MSVKAAPTKFWTQGSTSKARAIVRTVLQQSKVTAMSHQDIYSAALLQFPNETESAPPLYMAKKADSIPYSKALIPQSSMQNHPIRSMRCVLSLMRGLSCFLWGIPYSYLKKAVLEEMQERKEIFKAHVRRGKIAAETGLHVDELRNPLGKMTVPNLIQDKEAWLWMLNPRASEPGFLERIEQERIEAARATEKGAFKVGSKLLKNKASYNNSVWARKESPNFGWSDSKRQGRETGTDGTLWGPPIKSTFGLKSRGASSAARQNSPAASRSTSRWHPDAKQPTTRSANFEDHHDQFTRELRSTLPTSDSDISRPSLRVSAREVDRIGPSDDVWRLSSRQTYSDAPGHIGAATPETWSPLSGASGDSASGWSKSHDSKQKLSSHGNLEGPWRSSSQQTYRDLPGHIGFAMPPETLSSHDGVSPSGNSTREIPHGNSDNTWWPSPQGIYGDATGHVTATVPETWSPPSSDTLPPDSSSWRPSSRDSTREAPPHKNLNSQQSPSDAPRHNSVPTPEIWPPRGSPEQRRVQAFADEDYPMANVDTARTSPGVGPLPCGALNYDTWSPQESSRRGDSDDYSSPRNTSTRPSPGGRWSSRGTNTGAASNDWAIPPHTGVHEALPNNELDFKCSSLRAEASLAKKYASAAEEDWGLTSRGARQASPPTDPPCKPPSPRLSAGVSASTGEGTLLSRPIGTPPDALHFGLGAHSLRNTSYRNADGPSFPRT